MITPLCRIAFKYGTDKCPQVAHNYTPTYYRLFKGMRKSSRKVLELGIGCRETIVSVPEHYQDGASLLMWRDFFPNAQIYGVDIDPNAMLNSERIQTFLLDASLRQNLEGLVEKIGSDIDIVIDDGSHSITHQLRAARILMPLLKKDVIYIIEDARRPEYTKNRLSGKYNCESIEFKGPKRGEGLVVVRHK